MRRWSFSLLLLVAAGAARAEADAPPAALPPPVRTEEPSKPPTEQQPAPPAPKASPLLGKWSTDLYGFLELDGMHDSTQSFNDLAGNAPLARPNTYEGQHDRVTASGRNTRLGFRFASPEFQGMRAKGLLEADFFGNEPSVASSSEGSFFASPALRIRHAWLKLETPYVDVLMGQSWQLFGWQPYFHPNTVELQGVPGQIYARTPQIRLSRELRTEPVNVEVAVAAARPPQRDSGLPDGQAGIRVLANGWKGVHTLGGASTSIDAAAVGVSGAVRRFELGAPGTTNGTANAQLTPGVDHTATGWGVSFDGFLPVLPARGGERGNALSLTGSFARGAGIADMYTGLGFGLKSITAGGYVDPGLVVQADDGRLSAVEMRSWIVGAQYYLPGSGKVWFSGNYSRVDLVDPGVIASSQRSAVFRRSDWYNANVFWDVTPAIRVGGEYARFEQTYVDGVKAFDNRWQLSGWYLF